MVAVTLIGAVSAATRPSAGDIAPAAAAAEASRIAGAASTTSAHRVILKVQAPRGRLQRPDHLAAHERCQRARRAAVRQRAKRAAVAHRRELLPAVLASHDVAEGLRSFVERSAGRFTGRLPTRGGGT